MKSIGRSSIQLIATVALFSLKIQSTEGRYLGLNAEGMRYFQNMCKMQNPDSMFNSRPLLCTLFNFQNTTRTTTPPPVFVCSGPGTTVIDCPGFETGIVTQQRCPLSYSFATKMMERESCEQGSEEITTLPPSTTSLNYMGTTLAHGTYRPPGKNVCKGVFACIDMKCPIEVSAKSSTATCVPLRLG